jgi:hypothetical protein
VSTEEKEHCFLGKVYQDLFGSDKTPSVDEFTPFFEFMIRTWVEGPLGYYMLTPLKNTYKIVAKSETPVRELQLFKEAVDNLDRLVQEEMLLSKAQARELLKQVDFAGFRAFLSEKIALWKQEVIKSAQQLQSAQNLPQVSFGILHKVLLPRLNALRDEMEDLERLIQHG